ncbi:MAG: enoyl-CoA hydratase/isomerase family protein [Desulfuromonadales bacterium]|nr:enoyl-CoA hydratase/isomerase family protein [Desulfuromonadales bacterium]
MFAIEQQDEITLLHMQYGSANAMDVDFCTALSKTIKELAETSCKAIVLTGKGKIFCAGVDLPKLLEGGADYVRQFLPALDEVLETIFFCNKPVVAAVNGHAIAGGCLLACTADRRLMVDGKSQIGVPELRVGVPSPAVALEIMRAKTSSAFFEEVTLGAATYTAQEALKRGLIDEIVEKDQLLTEAISAAEALASIRPEIFSFSKQQIRQPVREAIDSRTKGQEAELFALWESDDTHAAVSAFVARTFKKV